MAKKNKKQNKNLVLKPSQIRKLENGLATSIAVFEKLEGIQIGNTYISQGKSTLPLTYHGDDYVLSFDGEDMRLKKEVCGTLIADVQIPRVTHLQTKCAEMSQELKKHHQEYTA